MKSLGHNLSQEEVAILMDEVDSDHNGTIDCGANSTAALPKNTTLCHYSYPNVCIA